MDEMRNAVPKQKKAKPHPSGRFPGGCGFLASIGGEFRSKKAYLRAALCFSCKKRNERTHREITFCAFRPIRTCSFYTLVSKFYMRDCVNNL